MTRRAPGTTPDTLRIMTNDGYRATWELPAALYIVAYGEVWDFDPSGDPYIFVYSGAYTSVEDAEAFIFDYATKPDERGTFNIIEYAAPPF